MSSIRKLDSWLAASEQARTLRWLAQAEQLAPPTGPRVTEIKLAPRQAHVTVTFAGGKTLQASSAPESRLQNLDMLNVHSHALDRGCPVPVEPTLMESWALFQYDVATSLDSLNECDPTVTELRVVLQAPQALCFLSSAAESQLFTIDLLGRTLEGASVDLMMRWNASHRAL